MNLRVMLYVQKVNELKNPLQNITKVLARLNFFILTYVLYVSHYKHNAKHIPKRSSIQRAGNKLNNNRRGREADVEVTLTDFYANKTCLAA